MINIVVNNTKATVNEISTFKKVNHVAEFIRKSRGLGFSVDFTIVKNDNKDALAEKLEAAALCACELAYEANPTFVSMKSALNNLCQIDIQSAQFILRGMRTKEDVTLIEQRDYLIKNGWKPTIIL